jgi:hypothetical protein
MPEPFSAALESLKLFWYQLGEVLPKLAAGLLLLIVGWLVAKMIRKSLIRLLKFVRLDVAAEKAGVEDFLLKGNVQYTTVSILANLVYWFILFAVMLAVMNSFGMAAAAELFNKIILFIPNVVIAVLVLIFGALFAKFVRGVSFTYLSNIGVTGAEFVSNLAQWALMVFVAFIALEQLSIGGQILVSAFQIAFGALCLALALAFGLGGREWAAHVLEKLWKK